jgi:hypothetical protein
MLKKLHDGEADIAITVTDGFIAGRAAGSNVSLIGTYVESPLTWAACAAPDSKLNSIDDFMNKGRWTLTHSLISEQKTRRLGSLVGRADRTRCHSTSTIYTACSSTPQLHSLRRISEFWADSNLSWLVGYPPSSSLTSSDRCAKRRSRPLSLGSLHHKAMVRFWRAQICECRFLSPSPSQSIRLERSARHGQPFQLSLIQTLLPTRPQLTSTSTDSFPLFLRVQLFLRSQETLPSNQQGWGAQDVLGEGTRSSGLTAAERIAADFGHKEEDAQLWLRTNRYSARMDVDICSLQKTVQILQQVGLVQQDFSLPSLWGGNENKAISFAPLDTRHPTEERPRSLLSEDR